MASCGASLRKKVIAVYYYFFFFPESEFPKRLIHAMEKQGMDSATLSMEVGVSPVTVKRWVCGKFEPRHRNLPRIANALCVSTDYLCGMAN